jgi:hypothetical protein
MDLIVVCGAKGCGGAERADYRKGDSVEEFHGEQDWDESGAQGGGVSAAGVQRVYGTVCRDLFPDESV